MPAIVFFSIIVSHTDMFKHRLAESTEIGRLICMFARFVAIAPRAALAQVVLLFTNAIAMLNA
jgi:hypothetical protein